MAVKKGKKTAKKTAKPLLVPQPNGKGALLAGGVPGNAGGTGRPRDAIRALCLEGAEKAVPVLVTQLAHEKPEIQQGAAEKLLKYGVGTMKEVSVEAVRQRVLQTLDVIRQHCSPDQAASIVNALKPVWA